MGDTGITPCSTGAYASRGMVMSGGAVSKAAEVLAGRVRRHAAHLLQCKPEDIRLAEGKAWHGEAHVGFEDIARAWYLRPDQLPDDVETAGLEVTEGYKPDIDTGVFTYATHAAIVEVDPDTGRVAIEDYFIFEDCGRRVNPLILEGQAYGGAAQGIGTALFEEVLRDANGQPLTSTPPIEHPAWPEELPSFRLGHAENAVTLHAARDQGRRRRRRHRAGRGHRQRGERRPVPLRGRTEQPSGHAGAYPRRDPARHARNGGRRMKPAPFELHRPSDTALAARMTGGGDGTIKPVAGGQSLGPMLNLRLTRPAGLVDITALPGLTDLRETATHVEIGAAVTHARIEDGACPEPIAGMLRHVAGGIAYRAVRNRGTIGGSLCHADPAADWITALTALGASVVATGGTADPDDRIHAGRLPDRLRPDEIAACAIRIPRHSPGSALGLSQDLYRKVGEFADAIAAFVADPQTITLAETGFQDRRRTACQPDLPPPADLAMVKAELGRSGLSLGAVKIHQLAVAHRRAVAEALSDG